MHAPLPTADAYVPAQDPLLCADAFRTAIRERKVRLPAAASRKVKDFADDLRLFADPATAPGDRTFLGTVYRTFERVFAPTRASPTDARDAPPLPSPFARDYAILDRMSLWYGGKYRGVIVLNYAFAMLAGFCLLGESVAEHLSHDGYNAASLRFEVAEFALVFLGVCFFLRGYTPERARPTSWIRKLHGTARRWHERWIEYRLLAERFRYAVLLQPFPGSTEQAWRRLMTTPLGTLGWTDQYFLWRVERVPEAPVDCKAWVRWLLDVMDEQAAYHKDVAVRCETMAHRLHRIRMGGFVAGLVLLLMSVVSMWIAVFGPTARAPDDCPFWLGIAGAGFGFIGGAAHGCAVTLELAKIAKRSDVVHERIAELRKRVAAKRALVETEVQTLRGDVEDFCQLVTGEASDWQALYRDKNVPLPNE